VAVGRLIAGVAAFIDDQAEGQSVVGDIAWQ
jgi:hypothetical protein